VATPSSVAILDYGVGNLTSVQNAVARLSVPVHITSDPKEIAAASHLILPGVGSFGEGMKGLTERGLIPILQQEVMAKKKPILGVCLGMQLLATEGFEHGHYQGLNFIPGTVKQIDTSESQLRLPHIGWNDVRITGTHAIAKGFTQPPVFYFVHSYCFVPTDPSVIAGVCEYGTEIVAILQSGTICGAQFHPEKSHDDGLKIFQNFLQLS